jgi:Sec63 Brl domain
VAWLYVSVSIFLFFFFYFPSFNRNWDFAALSCCLLITLIFPSYARMLKSPPLYGVGTDYQEDDPGLIQKHPDIAHSAAVLLGKCQLIKYDRQSGRSTSAELGRIASYYYVTYNSMMVYNQHLRPTMTMIELFRVFALSSSCYLWVFFCLISNSLR